MVTNTSRVAGCDELTRPHHQRSARAPQLATHPIGSSPVRDCEASLKEARDRRALPADSLLPGVAPAFPGWQSFGAMVTHFRFVRDHQKHVKKVAVVTDSAFGDIAEHLASHFVSAQIKQFPAGQVEAARDWIANESL